MSVKLIPHKAFKHCYKVLKNYYFIGEIWHEVDGRYSYLPCGVKVKDRKRTKIYLDIKDIEEAKYLF